MKFLSILLLLAISSIRSTGGETKLWSDNKLTSEQPFSARVRAIRIGWEGCSLLLEELGGSKHRLCIAEVRALQSIGYGTIKDTKAEEKAEEQRKKEGWTYLSPAIEVSGFSWSIGAHVLGARFGEDDILMKTAKRLENKTKEDGRKATPSAP